MQIRRFKDVENYLTTIRPDIKTVKWFFALEDMKAFMGKLDNPQNKTRVVHVAGTSGKTSTCYYLESMLRLADRTTGLTVSPHVDAVNERVQINGVPLDQDEFCELFKTFVEQPVVASMDITYFGLLVAFAFWSFAQKNVDYSVIEVGMGGRLDATNIITRTDKVCVITDIGLDHTKFLGEDLVSIAGEKAGIIQPNNHVFVARQAPEIMRVFEDASKAQNATLHTLPDEDIEQAPEFLPPFQKRNWALAKSAYDFIAKRDGLPELVGPRTKKSAQTCVPARMEAFTYQNKTIITDGSHNGQKISALVKGLKQKYPGKTIAAMIAFVEGKDTTLATSLQAIHEITDQLIVTTFDNSQDTYRQPMYPQTIADAAKEAGFKNVQIIEDPTEAFEELIKQQAEIYLVTGSFFLLNHVRPLLK